MRAWAASTEARVREACGAEEDMTATEESGDGLDASWIRLFRM